MNGQWAGYSYVWKDEQTDAELVPAEGTDRVYQIRDPKLAGAGRKQTWHYPSRAECMVCHSRAANWVLGLTTLQMNKEHDYGGVRDNQLRTLEHLGVFRVSEAAHLDEIRDRVRRLRGTVAGGLGTSVEAVGRALPGGQAALGIFEDARRLLSGPLAHALEDTTRPLTAAEKWLRGRDGFTTLLPRGPSEYGRLVD